MSLQLRLLGMVKCPTRPHSSDACVVESLLGIGAVRLVASHGEESVSVNVCDDVLFLFRERAMKHQTLE